MVGLSEAIGLGRPLRSSPLALRHLLLREIEQVALLEDDFSVPDDAVGSESRRITVLANVVLPEPIPHDGQNFALSQLKRGATDRLNLPSVCVEADA
jgi:hypothetical protein